MHLRYRKHFLAHLMGVLAWGAALGAPLVAQSAAVPSRVIGRVNDTDLVVLGGNTHLMARPQFDRGLVDAALPLQRIQLVLQRSSEQESALREFMDEQLDPASPNFHHWLHAAEFGALYGPSDADIAALTGWLAYHGFSNIQTSNGRVNVEFDGTAGQIQEAFHTEIHRYLVNGVTHMANDRDPQIPRALAPVVSGIASLHDFRPRHQSELGRFVTLNRNNHQATPLGSPLPAVAPVYKGPRPLYSFIDPNVGVQNEDIGPYDFAALYDLTPLWNAGITGKGVSIAIAAATDINLKDVSTFRSFFGLSKFSGSVKQVLNGADPGVIEGAVVENTLDTEWAGASAPDAEVLLVVSKGTATSSGGLLSITYIIDKEIAPIMSASYGECEAGLGKAGNANLNALYQQGSAEGISLFESAGDQGAAGCDNSDATVYPNPAQYGLQVRLQPVYHRRGRHRYRVAGGRLFQVLDSQQCRACQRHRLHTGNSLEFDLQQQLPARVRVHRSNLVRGIVQQRHRSRFGRDGTSGGRERREEFVPQQHRHFRQLHGQLCQARLADGYGGSQGRRP